MMVELFYALVAIFTMAGQRWTLDVAGPAWSMLVDSRDYNF
jgi:hypothetical protein